MAKIAVSNSAKSMDFSLLHLLCLVGNISYGWLIACSQDSSHVCVRVGVSLCVSMRVCVSMCVCMSVCV